MSYFREHLNIMTSEEQAFRAEANQEMRYTIIIIIQDEKMMQRINIIIIVMNRFLEEEMQ